MADPWNLSASVNSAVNVTAAPAPAAPSRTEPEETDADYLARLKAAIDRGAVRLDLDYKILAYGDSPVFSQSEDTKWFFAILAAVIAGFWFGGWIVGAATLALGVAVYLLVARRRMRRAIESRVRGKALGDIALWRAVWKFGGVSLARADGGAAARAPADNWFAFVRELPE